MKILKELKLKPRKSLNLNEWRKLVSRIEKPKKNIKIAMVGKYIDIGDYNLADSYVSINQSLLHAGAALNVGVDINWLDAKKFQNNPKKINDLKKFNGFIK